MNHLYVYRHENGLQFTSNARPLVLRSHIMLTTKTWNPIIPKLIGVWKVKTIKKRKDEE